MKIIRNYQGVFLASDALNRTHEGAEILDENIVIIEEIENCIVGYKYYYQDVNKIKEEDFKFVRNFKKVYKHTFCDNYSNLEELSLVYKAINIMSEKVFYINNYYLNCMVIVINDSVYLFLNDYIKKLESNLDFAVANMIMADVDENNDYAITYLNTMKQVYLYEYNLFNKLSDTAKSSKIDYADDNYETLNSLINKTLARKEPYYEIFIEIYMGFVKLEETAAFQARIYHIIDLIKEMVELPISDIMYILSTDFNDDHMIAYINSKEQKFKFLSHSL